jgi:hypothetical protein
MRKKNPKYKKDDLVKMIVLWSIEGLTVTDIKNDILALGYESTYFYDLYKLAKVIINEALVDISKDRLDITITEMELQYSKALTAGENKLALDIKKEINKISGLHNQKQELDITSQGDKLNSIEVIRIVEIKNEDEEND